MTTHFANAINKQTIHFQYYLTFVELEVSGTLKFLIFKYLLESKIKKEPKKNVL